MVESNLIVSKCSSIENYAKGCKQIFKVGLLCGLAFLQGGWKFNEHCIKRLLGCSYCTFKDLSKISLANLLKKPYSVLLDGL